MPKLDHIALHAGLGVSKDQIFSFVREKFRMKRVENESVSVDVVKLKASLIGLIKLGDAVDESECKKTNLRATT